jgi:hypothetical protein
VATLHLAGEVKRPIAVLQKAREARVREEERESG